MLVCVDAAYSQARVAAAAAAFSHWEDAAPGKLCFFVGRVPAPYVPGQLAARELPVILAVLAQFPQEIELVLVDGFVFLNDRGRLGLGGRLHQALAGRSAVVGVAKRAFAGAPAVPVWRGKSRHPLWVSAVGVEPAWAAEQVARMHGPFRLPTLLRLVDRCARQQLARAEAGQGAGTPQDVGYMLRRY